MISGLSILDFENALLLQIVHLFEDRSHVVTKIVELRHWHLNSETTTSIHWIKYYRVGWWLLARKVKYIFTQLSDDTIKCTYSYEIYYKLPCNMEHNSYSCLLCVTSSELSASHHLFVTVLEKILLLIKQSAENSFDSFLWLQQVMTVCHAAKHIQRSTHQVEIRPINRICTSDVVPTNLLIQL